MLITHTQPRPDLNDGQSHTPRKATALSVIHALAQVRAHSPIKTVKVPK